MIKIYNTLYGSKEALVLSRKKIKMFVCGPTVYDRIHIGNARTLVAFDIIVRYLRSRGYRILYLVNITDVDDKIIVRAEQEGVSWSVISKKYEKLFHQDMQRLNVAAVNAYPRATDHIPEIVKQVQTLIKKGHAYLISNDGWYFDLSTFPEYGKLSRRTAEQAEDATTRIDSSDRKRNRGDFCLWKLASSDAKEKGEPVWKTALGDGRPGWHIEDTAMTEHFFGPQYDIHGGAVDLKFPHHEAEIAQQEAASGKKPFVKLWMHAGFLLVRGEKMSKSKGNFVTMEEILADHSPDVFRMMVFSHHYRSPLDYRAEVSEQAKKNLNDILSFLAKLDFVSQNSYGARRIDLTKYKDVFFAAMDDDLNSPQAMAALFDLMADAHKDIWSLSKLQAKAIRKFLAEILSMLGFRDIDIKIPSKIAKLARKREISRKNKQFMQADALRKETEALGYSIEDTPLGPLVLPR